MAEYESPRGRGTRTQQAMISAGRPASGCGTPVICPWGMPKAATQTGRSRMDEPMFSKFDYYLDESDPDLVILRRQDGVFAAAFSARGATKEGIEEAAREDYGRLVEANADLLFGLRGNEGRQRSA